MEIAGWFSVNPHDEREKYHFVGKYRKYSDCGEVIYQKEQIVPSHEVMGLISYYPDRLCGKCKDFVATKNRKGVKLL